MFAIPYRERRKFTVGVFTIGVVTLNKATTTTTTTTRYLSICIPIFECVFLRNQL